MSGNSKIILTGSGISLGLKKEGTELMDAVKLLYLFKVSRGKKDFDVLCK